MVVLHGSHASGCAVSESDIDIGLLFQADNRNVDVLKILSDAVDVFGEKCDSVFLNNAEPLICYEVAINGIPLFESEESVFDEYQIKAMSRYHDSSKFRFLEREYLNQRVDKME